MLVEGASVAGGSVAEARACGFSAPPGPTNRATPDTTQKVTDLPRIDSRSLKALLDTGDAVVLDIRSRSAYEAVHLPGAICCPPEESVQDLPDLPQDKVIVTYCNCHADSAAAAAALRLLQAGYAHVRVLEGGLSDWVANSYPTETGK